jgi:hypothetical protein
MCPRDREELFHPSAVIEGAPATGQDMRDDQSGEVSGLSKIEAEDLLDRLEASGCDPCHLSFVDGEGFSVRPTVAPTADASDLVGSKDDSDGKPLSSLSACSR